jgi:hypothetical protein
MIDEPRINGQPADHPEIAQPGHQPRSDEHVRMDEQGMPSGQDASAEQVRSPPHDQGAEHDETLEETVDGLPVLAEVRTIERGSPASLPAVQAAAAAATGFVAGAATIALVKRRAARKVTRSRSAPRRAADMLPIVASRTFLVDVHLIKPQE